MDISQGYPNFQELKAYVRNLIQPITLLEKSIFMILCNLFAEFDGDGDGDGDDEKEVGSSKNQNQGFSLLEETLSCQIQGIKLQLTYSNLTQSFINPIYDILFQINQFQVNKAKIYNHKSNHENNVRVESAKKESNQFCYFKINYQEIEIPQHLQKDN